MQLLAKCVSIHSENSQSAINVKYKSGLCRGVASLESLVSDEIEVAGLPKSTRETGHRGSTRKLPTHAAGTSVSWLKTHATIIELTHNSSVDW